MARQPLTPVQPRADQSSTTAQPTHKHHCPKKSGLTILIDIRLGYPQWTPRQLSVLKEEYQRAVENATGSTQSHRALVRTMNDATGSTFKLRDIRAALIYLQERKEIQPAHWIQRRRD